MPLVAFYARARRADRDRVARPPARRAGPQPAEPHAGARAARPARARSRRHVLVTMTCGYALFAAAMGVYELIAGHPAAGIFPAAAREGAVLAFAIALPAFARPDARRDRAEPRRVRACR